MNAVRTNRKCVGARKPVLTDAEEMRAVILQRAAELFSRNGYEGATLRQIAERAGIEAGSIYYYFPSKSALLDEVLDTGIRELVVAMQLAMDDIAAGVMPFGQATERVVATHLKFILSGNRFISTNIRLYPTLPAQQKAAHRRLRLRYATLWDDFLRSAQQSGSLRSDIEIAPLRSFVLGALNWTVDWFNTKRYSVSDLAARATKLLLDGIATSHDAVDATTPSPVSSDVHHESNKAARTRNQILISASRVLRRKGYKATTMRSVAEEAGIEAGSLYYHFDSKEAIVDAVLDLGLKAQIDAVSDSAADQSQSVTHRVRIAAAIAAHLDCTFRHGEVASANVRIFSRLPPEVRERHRPLRDQYGRLWDRYLKEAQDAGEIRSDIKVVPLRQFMLGALDWTVVWFDPGRTPAQVRDRLSALTGMLQCLLLHGLRERAPGVRR